MELKVKTHYIIIFAALILYSGNRVCSQTLLTLDTVSFLSGKLHLKGLLWRPAQQGRLPAIIFCHGSYLPTDTVSDPVKLVFLLAPVFVKQGFVVFVPFRRGTGLSVHQGTSTAELMDKAMKQKGQNERNEVQLHGLESGELMDMISAARYLKTKNFVDTNRIVITGHSFGGSLALLLAEKELSAKAVIIYAGAGFSWNLSPQLRKRLMEAVNRLTMPIMFLYAQNDYSTSPAYALDSVMNRLQKPHLLKLYPKFGSTPHEGHNLIYLNPAVWQKDVFAFLEKYLGNLHR